MFLLDTFPLGFPSTEGVSPYPGYRDTNMVRFTDSFWERRYGGSRQHAAIDIACPEGTLVLAAHHGVIVHERRENAGGNVVYVEGHVKDGTIVGTYYAHLAAPGVQKQGVRAFPGMILGIAGHTGSASGPHLHFMAYARKGGKIMKLDPYQELMKLTSPVSHARGSWRRVTHTRDLQNRMNQEAPLLWTAALARRHHNV